MAAVLLVHDDIATIAAVRRLLSRAGHEVILATSEADAIIAFGHHLPALVILSPSVEGGRGAVFLEELSNHPSGQSARLLLLGAPVEGYALEVIPLPLDGAAFLETVESALRSLPEAAAAAPSLEDTLFGDLSPELPPNLGEAEAVPAEEVQPEEAQFEEAQFEEANQDAEEAAVAIDDPLASVLYADSGVGAPPDATAEAIGERREVEAPPDEDDELRRLEEDVLAEAARRRKARQAKAASQAAAEPAPQEASLESLGFPPPDASDAQGNRDQELRRREAVEKAKREAGEARKRLEVLRAEREREGSHIALASDELVRRKEKERGEREERLRQHEEERTVALEQAEKQAADARELAARAGEERRARDEVERQAQESAFQEFDAQPAGPAPELSEAERLAQAEREIQEAAAQSADPGEPAARAKGEAEQQAQEGELQEFDAQPAGPAQEPSEAERLAQAEREIQQAAAAESRSEAWARESFGLDEEAAPEPPSIAIEDAIAEEISASDELVGQRQSIEADLERAAQDVAATEDAADAAARRGQLAHQREKVAANAAERARAMAEAAQRDSEAEAERQRQLEEERQREAESARAEAERLKAMEAMAAHRERLERDRLARELAEAEARELAEQERLRAVEEKALRGREERDRLTQELAQKELSEQQDCEERERLAQELELARAAAAEAERRADVAAREAEAERVNREAAEKVGRDAEAEAERARAETKEVEARAEAALFSVPKEGGGLERIARSGIAPIERLAEIVRQVAASREDLRLETKSEDAVRVIRFRGGTIAGALSSVSDETLADRARQDGLIDAAQLAELRMARATAPSDQLEILRQRGYLRVSEVIPLVQRYTEAVALQALSSPGSLYRIAAEVVPPDVPLAASTRPLLGLVAEALRRGIDPNAFLQAAGGLRAVPIRARALDFHALDFADRERRLLASVDGEASIERLILASGLRQDPALRALAIARALGAIRGHPSTRALAWRACSRLGAAPPRSEAPGDPGRGLLRHPRPAAGRREGRG